MADSDRQRSATVRTRMLLSSAALVGLVAGAVGMWSAVRDDPADRPEAMSTMKGWPPAGAARVVTQVRPDGVVEVTHWIHVSEPLYQIDLVLPDTLQGESVEVSGVEVVTDRRRASGPAVPTFSRTSYVFRDATRIQVRYELSGAVELSNSAPGRGLLTTTALEVSPEPQRVTQVVRSEAVLSLACARPTSSPEPCGESDSDDQWHVELAGEDANSRVVAAVTVAS